VLVRGGFELGVPETPAIDCSQLETRPATRRIDPDDPLQLTTRLGAASRWLDDPFTRRTRSSKNDGATKAVKRRKRKGMTAAQKTEVSKRMKKYWAARRKAAAK
jgi:hypothetical protein